MIIVVLVIHTPRACSVIKVHIVRIKILRCSGVSRYCGRDNYRGIKSFFNHFRSDLHNNNNIVYGYTRIDCTDPDIVVLDGSVIAVIRTQGTAISYVIM